jgi:hypothetical protein
METLGLDFPIIGNSGLSFSNVWKIYCGAGVSACLFPHGLMIPTKVCHAAAGNEKGHLNIYL